MSYRNEELERLADELRAATEKFVLACRHAVQQLGHKFRIARDGVEEFAARVQRDVERHPPLPTQNWCADFAQRPTTRRATVWRHVSRTANESGRWRARVS